MQIGATPMAKACCSRTLRRIRLPSEPSSRRPTCLRCGCTRWLHSRSVPLVSCLRPYSISLSTPAAAQQFTLFISPLPAPRSQSINTPLRSTESRVAHPLPITVHFISEGIKKLRALDQEVQSSERSLRDGAEHDSGGAASDGPPGELPRTSLLAPRPVLHSCSCANARWQRLRRKSFRGVDKPEKWHAPEPVTPMPTAGGGEPSSKPRVTMATVTMATSVSSRMRRLPKALTSRSMTLAFDSSRSGAAESSKSSSAVVLWRGIKDASVHEDFMKRGGTEVKLTHSLLT